MRAIPINEEDIIRGPRPKTADPKRVGKEFRREERFGAALESAAAEASARVLRAQAGPPPTEAEQAILAESAHKPAQLFSEVLVTDLEFGEQETYTIVPDGEGALEENRISLGSPIGRALLQEYPGAVVQVKTPAGKRLYRILRVT